MKKASPGFAVVMVLLLVAAISVVAIASVRTNGFLTTLAIRREQQEYNYWAMKGLVNYAKALLQNQEEIPVNAFRVSLWPSNKTSLDGIIEMQLVGDKVMITTQLINGKKLIKKQTSYYDIPLHLLV